MRTTKCSKDGIAVRIQAGAEVIGWPLASTLADLLGYNVAHEDWPPWIDDLAREIESAL
jgi:hypothetical protein